MFKVRAKFKDALHPEFLKIERERVLVILIIFFISTIMIPVSDQTMPNLFNDLFSGWKEVRVVIILWIVFCLFEIMVFLRMNYAIKNNIEIPKRVLFLNIFIEFGLPTLLLYQVIKYDYSLIALEYDGLTFYFLLLMLTAMHLDFKISFCAGMLASVGYLGVAIWATKYIESANNLPNLLEIYGMRSVGLLMAGVVAGIVALEIKKRVNSYLKTAKQQQQVELLLGQQLSKSVANELILHNDERFVNKVFGSIMFLDFRNFTSVAENQRPEETIEFQNAIFDPLIRIIEKNNGIIHQILGDGFLASFGIAVKNKNHINDSFNAGIEIVEAISDLKLDNCKLNTKVGIGLHCGEIVTGNIGNEIRKQFSLAGKNVIIAARIEQLNKKFNTQFIVSGRFANLLPCKKQLVNLGKLKLKGLGKKIRLYQVV